MVMHHLTQAILGGRVERCRWLVEKPDRPRHGQHPGKRKAPPLPCREVAGWELGEVGQADLVTALLGEGGHGAVDCAADKPCPERQVFSYRQGRFEGIEMPHIVRLL